MPRTKFRPNYDQLMHRCNSIPMAYENLVNAIFHQAYEDLVVLIRKGCRKLKEAREEPRTFLRWELHDQAMRYMKEANYLKGWFREVMPAWRDINPDRVIEQAYKECKDDTEAVFGSSAITKGKI